jgi:hypothetical protein
MPRRLSAGFVGGSLIVVLCATVAGGQSPYQESPPGPSVPAAPLVPAPVPVPTEPPVLPGEAIVPPEPAPPKEQHPSGEHTHERAGYPSCISPCAQLSDTDSYVGYYVGGGAPCCGQPRCATDGTWGWDYQGCLLPRRVALDWWHGLRSQGGIGAYRTVAEPSCFGPSTP